MKYRRASFFIAALVIGLSPPGYAAAPRFSQACGNVNPSFLWGNWVFREGLFLRRAVPPFPLLGTAFYVSVKGEWFSLPSLPESSLETLPAPEEGILPGLPGKPFLWGPWVCILGKPYRVLIPFPEVQEGGFLVDEGKKWHLYDPHRKKVLPAEPLEGYVQVDPGKAPGKAEPGSDP